VASPVLTYMPKDKHIPIQIVKYYAYHKADHLSPRVSFRHRMSKDSSPDMVDSDPRDSAKTLI